MELFIAFHNVYSSQVKSSVL